MNEREQSKLSEDSVLALLTNFKDDGPDDVTHFQLLVDAREKIDELVNGDVLYKNAAKTIYADAILHALINEAPRKAGQRYVAQSILHCKTFRGREKKREFLLLAAGTWFDHLLSPGA